jgi:hypothetical protein
MRILLLQIELACMRHLSRDGCQDFQGPLPSLYQAGADDAVKTRRRHIQDMKPFILRLFPKKKTKNGF